ncbi:hypothetical protein BK133_18545 [Paenibacillus sp. FSL H8-0548]|uniref:ATP-binding protein n=1 Tax=Paenibacillus sp. FSL H8-0548 TaxID=1920422 RepID=UPI00096E637B|nr:ATP-binding protein [Paenibacillus sp. FSL H8-0548]OMF28654.1 hypothetical protein BK133_18545 [Paenibacillus sp. FSL H8-0548]
MKKSMVAAIVTLLLLITVYGALLFYASLLDKPRPSAVRGALDLSSWSFEQDGIIQLDGEWELYPDKLLSHRDFHSSSAQESLKPAIIQVPGSWSSVMDIKGMATYRLRIQLGDTSAVFGLKTGSIYLSNRLIVNGEIVGSSGEPAEKREYRALNKPFVSYFTLQPGWNEIMFHVANYELSVDSGIIESIYFGTADQIAGIRDKAQAHDWITLTAFLIIGLYFTGLYSQRKKDRSSLVFGLMCLCIAVFTSTRGERLLLQVAGELPFWLYIRIQMISAIGGGLGFLLYVYTAFRPYCSKWIVRVGLIIGILLAALYLFGASMATEQVRQLTTIYVTFPLIYATYIFVAAALHKVEGSKYLAVAAIALNIFAVKQNMNIYFGVPVYMIVPLEPFLVLLMLALLMSLRFSNAFHKIEELSEQLLQTDKLKDDFLARTSHEFKTPLHGVMNISKSMLDDATQPLIPEQREKLGLIVGIMSRLSQLVYDILDLSRLKQGELRVAPTPIDVRSAVEVQMRIYSYLSIERNIRLTNAVPAHLPAAFADESRFSQIIGNLLDNAVKHTENGSITVMGAVRDNMIEISVQDTGEGIEPDAIPYLFEPFKSFDAEERSGFGLGLSIAKQLAELQHGALSVASVLGAGSTFTFTLPIANEAIEAKPDQPDSRVMPRQAEYSFVTPYDLNRNGKHTVLIVDDQFVNLKILLDVLQTLDYHVIAVKSGYEALEQVDTPGKIDLVILDLMMPGMSGYEVCQEIRKRYTLLELPILMVTSAIQEQDKTVAFQAGANDYLPKPFDREELKARIRGLLAMKESLAKAVHLEVAFLQSQIKPHFLYNVLNSIVASSYTDIERARNLIVDLADYLRGSFRFSNTEGRIPFQEEYNLIQTYVNIEHYRFKDRIRFEADIAEEAFDLRIPPLLLQPLVENAIRHGIGDRIEGGTVTLTVSKSDGQWLFVVSDDGIGIEPRRLQRLLEGTEIGASQGVGLLNINKRLKYEYGIALELDSEPGRGTKVTVRIQASQV